MAGLSDRGRFIAHLARGVPDPEPVSSWLGEHALDHSIEGDRLHYTLPWQSGAGERADFAARLQALLAEQGAPFHELAEEETDRNEAANGERRTANGQTPVDAEWLADLVADVLELPEVDTDTSLLSLGATSLDMLRVAARLEHATGESVELEELFTAASLSALAGRLPQPLVA